MKRTYKHNVYILIIILYSAGTDIKAQESSNSSVNNQVWVDFNVYYKISDSFDFRAKGGTKSVFPNVWNKAYTSAEIYYNIPNFIFQKIKHKERVYGGIDFYHAVFDEAPNVIEISPYQGYTLFLPNRKRIIIKHNVELGERFQWDVKDWNYSFGLKLSYEASLTFKFQGDLVELGKGFYLSVSAKFWWNLISTSIFNDVMRITPGIGYQINPKWKAAFYIGYNYTKNQVIDEFKTDNVIYRLRLYFNIN